MSTTTTIINNPVPPSGGVSNNNTNMNQSSYTEDLPQVMRKPFPKALLIQPDSVRRQKAFIGLTSKRFCVTCAESPAHAATMLSFPFNGYTNTVSVSGNSYNNSGSDFDVIFVDCESFDDGGVQRENNNFGGDHEQDRDQQTSTRNNMISAMQFVHSTRMREYSSLQAFVTTSKDFEEQNAAAAHRLLLQREKERETAMLENKNSNAATPALLYNDPRLKHLVGMSFEERKAREEKDLEEKIKAKTKSLQRQKSTLGSASFIVAENLEEGLQDAKKAMRNRRLDESEIEQSHKHSVETARINRSADIFSVDSLVSAPPSELDKNSKPVKSLLSRKGTTTAIMSSGASVRPSLKSLGASASSFGGANVEDSIIGSDFIQNLSRHEFFRDHQHGDEDDDDEDGEDGRNNNNTYTSPTTTSSSVGTRKKFPDTLIVEGRTVQKLLLQRHRHIIIGMCTQPQTREKFADLVINTQTMSVENYLKVHPSSRHACIPLFDAVIRYPFHVHLDRLESIFVAREESIAQFAEAPNLKQLAAILADISQRRVGGMLRVCDAPDWRKLTQALERNNAEQTLSLLQPIPKVFRVAKDQATGVSTHLTNIPVNDGLTIPMAATNALLRAQADVRRTRERLGLEKDAFEAVNVELEAGHVRNQELTARIEKSLEEQKKLEDKVKFLSEQLARKETEAIKLREETKTSIGLAEEASRQYEALCGHQVKTALENEKAREYYEYEIDRLKKMNGIRSSRGNNPNNNSSSAITYSNVGGTAVPLKNVAKNNNNNNENPRTPSRGGGNNQEKQQPLTPVPPPAPPSILNNNNTNNSSTTNNTNQEGKGSAFRSFDGSLTNTLRQDARTVEVDIGLDAPIYLDLLTESRVKCLSYMRENAELRQQVFHAQSRIFQLINAHVNELESLGLIKFQIGHGHHHHNHPQQQKNRTLATFTSALTDATGTNQEGGSASSSSSQNDDHDQDKNNSNKKKSDDNTNYYESERHTKMVDNYFASFRRSNLGPVVADASHHHHNKNIRKQNDDEQHASEILDATMTRSRTTSLQPQTAENSSFVPRRESMRVGKNSNNNNEDENRLFSSLRNNNHNNNTNQQSFLQEQKFLMKELNNKWKKRMQAQSQFYERQVMEAQDLVSSFTIEENVMNLVKTGVKFSRRVASLDFDKLKEVRCRAEFADDAVRGALETDAHAVITQTQLGRRIHAHNNNPMDALDQADAELLQLAQQQQLLLQNSNNNNNHNSSSSPSPRKRKRSSSSSSPARQNNNSNNNLNNASLRRRLRNAAINIASTQGSGGTAAAVIASVIETAQNRSREPIRAFLRKNLDQMWSSVRRVTQSTMMDVMTTHSALSHGLERLLSGSGFVSSSPQEILMSNNNNNQQQQQQQQQQQAINVSALVMASSTNSRSNLTSPQAFSLSSPQTMNLHSTMRPNNHQQQQQAAMGATAVPLMRREKQQQLAMSLRRLFLDRVVGAINKLSDSLAEQFSRNVYETYLGAIEVMEEEIFKAVQPVALENAKLATSLLMAKTAAHNQLGLLVKQLKDQHQQILQKEKELKQQQKKLQQQEEATSSPSKRSGSNSNRKSSPKRRPSREKSTADSSITTAAAASPQISSSSIAAVLATLDPGNLRLPDYFGKEVNTRDGWCQTRPVLIRDPLTTDIV